MRQHLLERYALGLGFAEGVVFREPDHRLMDIGDGLGGAQLVAVDGVALGVFWGGLPSSMPLL